ncbi:MAG: triose-phosphate isomerase [Clostridia bacterium]|nr:triose-phosphate isomerase [Clostridia bacterium]
MDKFIVANWKMNNDFSDIPVFVDYLKENASGEKNMIVCVPSVMVKTFADTATGIAEAGAENCYYLEKGAYTGEISPQMVKSAGATTVLVGHSERRQLFGETNELLNKKVLAALDAGLKVIYCIGETLEEKPNYQEVLRKELVEGLANVKSFENLIVAYEPIWAIGTGKVATIEDIDEIHTFVKETISSNFGANVPILYGGSVKPSNSGEILSLDSVGGVLIGGASLKAEDYVKIVKSRG